eukprot:1385966-Amorphochlora_amoeboformis.AAC.1
MLLVDPNPQPNHDNRSPIRSTRTAFSLRKRQDQPKDRLRERKRERFRRKYQSSRLRVCEFGAKVERRRTGWRGVRRD